ncbi:hypothetical protein EAF04_007132 [Stromatinia cepivora]|nr:hypothetical protein EAF04_007132 [Stromatinia cepivora]
MPPHTPAPLQNDVEQNTMFHGSDIHYYELHADGKKYQVLVNAITGDPIYHQEMKNGDLEGQDEVEDMDGPDLDHSGYRDDSSGDVMADDTWGDIDAEVEIPQWHEEDEDGYRDREWAEESEWESERRWWYEEFLAEHTRWENRRWREMIEEEEEEYALVWVYPDEWDLWKRSHRRYGGRYAFFRLLLFG